MTYIGELSSKCTKNNKGTHTATILWNIQVEKNNHIFSSKTLPLHAIFIVLTTLWIYGQDRGIKCKHKSWGADSNKEAQKWKLDLLALTTGEDDAGVEEIAQGQGGGEEASASYGVHKGDTHRRKQSYTK